MRRIKRLSIPMLLGVVLMIMLVGVANARPNARPQEQAWRVLTVGANVCMPTSDGTKFIHHFDYLHCFEGGLGSCFYLCPLNFPAAGEQAVGAVNVKRLTMYYFDCSQGDGATARLYKSHPPTQANVKMAEVVTTRECSPTALMDTTIQHNPVYRVQSPYISLSMDAANFYSAVYGFYIHYTWL